MKYPNNAKRLCLIYISYEIIVDDKLSYLIFLFISLNVSIALFFFFKVDKGIFVKHSANSVFLIDENFGDHKPGKTTILSFLLITHCFICAQDTTSHLAKDLVIQKILISVELDDVAAKIKKHSFSTSIGRETFRIFKISIVGFCVLYFVFVEMTT